MDRYQDPAANPLHDPALVAELFDRYLPLVYGVCLKYLRDEDDAKDAVMEVYEKLTEALKTQPVVHFGGWLRTLVRNHCLMWLRSRQSQTGQRAATRRLDDLPPGLAEASLPAESFDDEVASHEALLSQLEAGLLGLPAEQRTCLELFYWQQKCYQEIAQLTGFELSKVKSYLQNGKRNLKIHVEKNR